MIPFTPGGGPRAAIVGIAGQALTAAEFALFRDTPPAGAILFARNVHEPAQVAALTRALRDCLGPDAVILVDQEGGRVARLKPPHWLAHPAADVVGALHGRDPRRGLRAAWLTGALIGLDCAGVGIDVACAPVLDVRQSGADAAAVGDRAFSGDADAVAALGAAMADGLLAAGVQPVGKHAPGHGRATADSHHGLPRVAEADLSADLLPFRSNAARLPWLMTAHIVFEGLDPDTPATLSRRVVRDIIRGAIGFDGVLSSDDLAMHALTGPPEQRACRAIEAGCDVALYCPGDPHGNAAVLRAVPALAPRAAARLAAGAALARKARLALDRDALLLERDEILK